VTDKYPECPSSRRHKRPKNSFPRKGLEKTKESGAEERKTSIGDGSSTRKIIRKGEKAGKKKSVATTSRVRELPYASILRSKKGMLDSERKNKAEKK